MILSSTMKATFLLTVILLSIHCTAFLLTHKPSYKHTPSKALMASTSEDAGAPGSLQLLCTTSLQACEVMTPLISTIYNDLSKSEVKTKQDNSAFTIADGLVQRLLYVLFASVQFRGIVGEEDTICSSAGEGSWDQVDGLTIPKHILPIVQFVKSKIEALSSSLRGDYSKISVFIDPIDGTKEFSTGKGEQCSICIGFADEDGKAAGGVVYRPLTLNPTWAAGAISERYADHNFDLKARNQVDEGGLLTSNGSISKFIESLMIELGVKRVKAGGAGNKMLLLLERSLQLVENSTMSSMLYIQDRGVSRWDTCAAEAVVEAFGGRILKLTSIRDKGANNFGEMNGRYTYLRTETNLDFIPGSARLTKYNRVGSQAIQSDQMADDVHQVKPYSNLCGLVAFGNEWNNVEGMKLISDAVQRAGEKNAPSYD